MRLSRDGFAGLAVLAASCVLFVQTLGLKASSLVPIGPGFYPRIVLGITAFFSVLLVVADALEQRRGQEAVAAPAGGARPAYALVALNFGLFGLYVLALPGVGFRISTLLYVALANLLLAPPKGWGCWGRALALGAGTAFLAHFVFESQLSVLLPRGRWTGF